MRVKITQKGWATYSDVLGTVQFKDAVSQGDISRREALALGAFVSVVEIDEDGNELGPVSPAHDVLMASKVSGYVERSTNLMDRVTNRPSDHPEIENMTDDPSLSAPLAEARRAQAIAEGRHQSSLPARQVVSQSDLEALASAKGITGLREIAEPMGLKGTSIKGLIAEIMKAQRNTAPRLA